MQSFNKVFFRGLITLLPITLTIYILYSAIIILDNLLGSVLKVVMPAASYIPGFGLLLTLILIYVFGLLLNNYITGRLLMSLEERLTKVPFLKAIYSPLRDLMNLFKHEKGHMGSVVIVKIGDTGMQLLGVITRDSFVDLPIHEVLGDRVAVYIPYSYALGGYTVLVPRTHIIEVNLPLEKAMSLAITGWVKADHHDRAHVNETEAPHGNHQ
jgi:uncharacterized membrane protein